MVSTRCFRVQLKKVATGAYDPSFDQFGKISIVDCDQFYELQLEDGFKLIKNTINNYQTQCDYQITSDSEAIRVIIDHLTQNKFDTSTLDEWQR